MRIFPIYESCQLFNTELKSCERLSHYICMSADNAHIIVFLHNGIPINIRWFTDTKEYKKFINTIKKSYKKYEEYKEELRYCNYPDAQENLPF